mmetsp:Transcript_42868/g.93265  ORF Transcript_42868/g.93265 Transcript_42868/m.93265 type:complete len:127 (+) Transcript_42868:473-853(+)
MQGADSGRRKRLDCSDDRTLEACQQGQCGEPLIELIGLEPAELHAVSVTCEPESPSRCQGESMPWDREADTDEKHLRKARPGRAGCPFRSREGVGSEEVLTSGGHQSSCGTKDVKGRRNGEPRNDA